MGAVIPTITTRAIEAVDWIVKPREWHRLHVPASGAALMFAVSTAVFSAVSARDLQGSLARRIVLEPDQRQVVQEIIAGARNVDALPLRTAAEVKDPAGIVHQAYQSGLSVVLWLSAALVSISIVLVWRLVKPSAAPPAPLAVRAAESPPR